MTCPTVIRVTTSQGPPGIGLPAGTADAGKFVRKAGSAAYAYELVTPDQVGLPQGLAPSSSPTFAGLSLSGIAANQLLYSGVGGSIGAVSLGSGLAIVGGALVVTGGGGGGGGYPALVMPTGFSVSGNGTAVLTVSYSAGYSLPSNTTQASWSAGAALATTSVQEGDSRLTDAREWTALDVTQLEAEGGTATTSRKWSSLRVRQAIAAWFSTVSGVAGRAILLAADSTAQRLLLGLGTTDSPSFAGLTITGTAAVSIPHIHGSLAGPSYIHVKSAHSALMTKGTPVHIVGSVGDTDVVEVIPADASDPTRMPAVGLLDADVAPNGNGHVVVGGELLSLSTAGYSQGEAAWVAAGGGLTATRPTTGLAQQVAIFGRIHATTGSVTVVPGTALVAAIAAQTTSANLVLAGPTSGTATAPSYRALVATDLPTTTVAAATYGSASQVGAFTVDSRGRLTFAGNVPISISAAAVSGLGSAAAAATTDFATAAQGAKADTAIQPGNAALTDAREWSAETISQAEAEAGTATTRRAFTAQRVFQAIAAWWAASAAATKLAGIAAGATANATDAQLRDRSTHTGTQAASTITGLATVATSGAYGDLSGRPTLFDPASPGAIGGTTPAAGSFTSLTTSTRLGLPSGAPASPAARDLYAVADTLRYRDSSGTERLILNATDNLSNLANVATARTNLGAAASGSIITSGLTLTSSRIVGRSSSGTGAPEEFSLTGLAFAGSSLATLADLMIPLSDATGTALTVGTREVIPYLQRAYVLTELPVWSVGTPPAGSALQLDIRVGGTSIFSTLPTIAAGSTNSTSSPGAFSTAFVTGGQTIAAGSSVTFHVTQIGSTTAGAVLRVSIPVRRAS